MASHPQASTSASSASSTDATTSATPSMPREAAEAEEDRAYAESYLLGELVPFLEDEHKAARDELRRYKRELGLLGEE